jgi:hypothetical protein
MFRHQLKLGFAIAVCLTAYNLCVFGQSASKSSTPSGTSVQPPSSIDPHLIHASGIGRIRLGITLSEAKKVLPAAKFERSSDGDGAALIDVKLGAEELMTIWADEDNADAPIAWSKRIITIETFSPSCHLENGIHPGSLVVEAERLFGKTKQIDKSEVESREQIIFQQQPTAFTFRVDDAGVFKPNSSRTTKFVPKATLLSISVSSIH